MPVAQDLEALREARLQIEYEGHAISDQESIDDDGVSNMSFTSAVFTAEEHVEARFVHPGARTLFARAPFVRSIPVLGQAITSYGPKATLSISLCYLIIKGIGDQTVYNSAYPIFNTRYKTTAVEYQRYSAMRSLGWSVKPLVALVCDLVAIFGYTKRWYMGASCLIGAAITFGYAFLPANHGSAQLAAAFYFLSNLFKANVDILSEGHYSRLLRQHPSGGSALVTFIWWGIMVGCIIAGIIQGPLSDANIPQVGVAIASGLQAICVVFFVFNWFSERKNKENRAEDAFIMHKEELKEQEAKDRQIYLAAESKKNLHPELDSEEREDGDPELVGFSNEPVMAEVAPAVVEETDIFEVVPPKECCCGALEFNTEVFWRNTRVMMYCVVMTMAVVVMTCINILGTSYDLLYASIAVTVSCLGMSFYSLPLVIAKANLFGYMQQTFYLQMSALDNFYLATPDCLPNGPHFSFAFYNTMSSVVGNVGGLIGATAFNFIFSKRSYRLALTVTTFIQVVASIFDLVIVKRWNVDIGIPDHVMYVLGDAIVYQVCYMLGWMPMVILLSRLCPRGSESMVYALLAGFSNFGQSMSSSISALLMQFIWPITSTPPSKCDFSNLWKLVVTGHLVLPLLCIPFVFLLIPAARVSDDLDLDGNVIEKKPATRQHHHPHRSELNKKQEESTDNEPAKYPDSGSDSAAQYYK